MRNSGYENNYKNNRKTKRVHFSSDSLSSSDDNNDDDDDEDGNEDDENMQIKTEDIWVKDKWIHLRKRNNKTRKRKHTLNSITIKQLFSDL